MTPPFQNIVSSGILPEKSDAESTLASPRIPSVYRSRILPMGHEKTRAINARMGHRTYLNFGAVEAAMVAVRRGSLDQTDSLLYVISCRGFGTIKIGVSKNPIQRLAKLQQGSLEKLTIEFVLKGGRSLEYSLHAIFGACCERQREWFEVNETLLSFVQCAAPFAVPFEPKPVDWKRDFFGTRKRETWVGLIQ